MADIERDFGEFAHAQSSRLLGLAYALTGNPQDAWDLVQETLVRVGIRWRRLRDEDPSAYATTVLVRLNIDRLRRLRREFPVIEHAVDEFFEDDLVDDVAVTRNWDFGGYSTAGKRPWIDRTPPGKRLETTALRLLRSARECQGASLRLRGN